MSTSQTKQNLNSDDWVAAPGDSRPGYRPTGVAPWAAEPTLSFTLGELTRETSDAIANPAGAGLVDLTIRQAAGPDLLEDFHAATARLPEGRLVPGRAVLTRGFRLRAPYVIHCGPPVYLDGAERARADLASCHVEALRLAREHRLRSISFPAIGTGMHRFPFHEAAEVAVRTVLAELAAHATPLSVRVVLFRPNILNTYVEAAVVALRALPERDKSTSLFKLPRSE